MAEKLDWLNKHLVLLRYLTVEDAVAKENYKIRPDLAELCAGVSGTEDMVFKFAGTGQYKDACEFMAYITHRRVGVWWVYRCINSLIEELGVNPAVDRDIADIGADFEVTVPEWAKIELPKMDPAVEAEMKAMQAASQAQLKEAEAMLDQEMLAYVREAVEHAFQDFKKVHGIHPIDLLKKAASRINEDPYPIDPASPVFTESAKLKAQLGALQKETVDTIKSVLPPKVPEHEKKLRDNAMDAVYRWVVSPDAENSQKCLDIGNECPDTPAGLLSLASFWAFGNLMPSGDQVVATPPGLASNGLVQTLLMCALHKGGTRKVKERYEIYFNIGLDVLTGKDNWEESLAAGIAPHRQGNPMPQTDKKPDAEQNGYKRWDVPPKS
ncbi:hypothetical protein AGMMS50268_15270 [Spirochaetia bacterium]|nr:hypothetical protein AGMMS50268_15270 [Spirochaetia bacterium]